jgi:hypothetical protein
MPIFSGENSQVSMYYLYCYQSPSIREEKVRATLLDGQCQGYKTLYPMLIFGRNTGFTKPKLHDCRDETERDCQALNKSASFWCWSRLEQETHTFPGNSAAWVTEEHGQPATCLHTVTIEHTHSHSNTLCSPERALLSIYVHT